MAIPEFQFGESIYITIYKGNKSQYADINFSNIKNDNMDNSKSATYSIKNVFDYSHDTIEIDQTEMEAFHNFLEIMQSRLAIEEHFDILVENFIEFERELLSNAVHFMVRPYQDHRDFYRIKSSLNRRMMNFLSSAKFYFDSLLKLISKASSNKFDDNHIKKHLTNPLHANNFGYQFMEELRNYCQHRSLPIEITKSGFNREISTESNNSKMTIGIFCNNRKLKSDPKFKNSISKNLDGEETDILPLAKSYMSCISEVQEGVRKILAPIIKECSEDIISRLKRHEGLGDYKHIYLIKESGGHYEEAMFSLTLLDSIEILEKRNSGQINLKNRYVSEH